MRESPPLLSNARIIAARRDVLDREPLKHEQRLEAARPPCEPERCEPLHRPIHSRSVAQYKRTIVEHSARVA